MRLKHRANINFPENVQNPLLVFRDLFKLLQDTLKNIFDDLTNLSVGRSAALPTASVDYLGRFWLKENAGAADTLHICIFNGATSTYQWKEVTLV